MLAGCQSFEVIPYGLLTARLRASLGDEADLVSLGCREKIWSSWWTCAASLTYGGGQPQVEHPPLNVSKGSVQRA